MIKTLVGWVNQALNSTRKTYWTARVKCSCGSYQGKIAANYKTNVGRTTHLGNNVNFNGLRVSGGGRVEIGDNFHSGEDCLLITQVHNYNHGETIPYDSTYIYKEIVIKDNVWLGSRVIVLGGVTIGEGAIVQAGSVIVSDVPDYAITGGHPAKVFRYRDIEHYVRLKQEGKFH